MPDAHPLDGVADDLLDWLQTETSYYIDALKGGHRAPFTAPVNEQQKREYFGRQLFNTNPDGSTNYDSPNHPGRDRLLKQIGIKNYVQVVKDVMPKQGLQAPMPEEPTEQPAPTDGIDVSG